MIFKNISRVKQFMNKNTLHLNEKSHALKRDSSHLVSDTETYLINYRFISMII